jgi:hypothetical protein
MAMDAAPSARIIVEGDMRASARAKLLGYLTIPSV